MDKDLVDLNHSTFATFNSPQLRPQLSPPQTPTYMRHTSISDPMLDDYIPSDTIFNESEEDYVTEDEDLLPEPTQSGRSSISSFPASIIHHDIRPSQTFMRDGFNTPSRSCTGTPTSFIHSLRPISPLSTKDHLTGFRNVSSVRALQMRDELSDPEDLTPGHRRHGSRPSYMSHRSGSTHSTPGKRMSRSLQASPVKSSRLRKEFPLVLLHCSIIPSIINPKAKTVSAELLEAIVPEPYKKRWKLLHEKVLTNFEVRERGVLIPHPREDYDLLEERLLESLELEQPVLRNGHFVGRSDSRASATDSGFGSEENSNRGDLSEGEAEEQGDDTKCMDCGGLMCKDKRWEVKVFAANGLMRAGAWSAAWSEMEKVDVQVSVCLPEDVRREIEARLDAVLMQEQQLQEEEIHGKEDVGEDERTREIYGETIEQKKQEEVDGLEDDGGHQYNEHPDKRSSPDKPVRLKRKPSPPDNIDLQQALINYVKIHSQDHKNIAILLLGILLAIVAMQGLKHSPRHDVYSQLATNSLVETKVEYLTTTVFSTSTSTAIETSTVLVPTGSVQTSLASASTQIDELTASISTGLPSLYTGIESVFSEVSGAVGGYVADAMTMVDSWA